MFGWDASWACIRAGRQWLAAKLHGGEGEHSEPVNTSCSAPWDGVAELGLISDQSPREQAWPALTIECNSAQDGDNNEQEDVCALKIDNSSARGNLNSSSNNNLLFVIDAI